MYWRAHKTATVTSKHTLPATSLHVPAALALLSLQPQKAWCIDVIIGLCLCASWPFQSSV